ncbi:glycosyltransferase [Piscinibacter sakaiensis]|uniref:Glycosyl transferase family 1 domain-containing protein n=1 Tax=Piscinibacter sakaiensis TaxID=1547922 RepID=A0A0K8P7T0_PISS1|nr:glycosyltransferase [Piscinibacter sakaiensis]GAP38672.1 hypothetical protein ISF6_5225 [Piscinibacter sakaiensis]
MRKLLFVDHAFHRTTRSSEFFVRILRRFFEVEILDIEPEEDATPLPDLSRLDHDLVVLWQMDYLAPAFIARGMRVVVVPMYDGSSSLPDVHWVWARQARFLCFSRRLHHRIERAGGRALRLRYYKPARAGAEHRAFDRLRVFLWQRRPEHGLNLALVERLFGSQLESVHVHDSADDRSLDTSPYLARQSPQYRLTRSSWFKNGKSYEDLLTQHNVFIAPRRSEGIGMGFLEAMAHGMLVVANADSTHDEYISNWVSGLLIDPDRSGPVHVLDQAPRIAHMAWKTCEIGYDEWMASIPGMIDFIRATPAPSLGPGLDAQALAEQLTKAYYAGIGAYVDFLLGNGRTLARLLGRDARAVRFGGDGQLLADQAQPRPASGLGYGSALPDEPPWLEQNRFRADVPGSDRYLASRHLKLDRRAAWLNGDGASFVFRMDPRHGSATTLALRYLAHPEGTAARYLLILNDTTVGEGRLEGPGGELLHRLDGLAPRIDNVLRLQLMPPDPASAGLRPAVGIAEFAFR